MHVVVGILYRLSKSKMEDQRKMFMESEEAQNKFAESVRQYILQDFDDRFFNNIFDWRQDGPGRWDDYYGFKRNGLILGIEQPETLFDMVSRFSKRPLQEATKDYLQDKYFYMYTESLSDLRDTVKEFNAKNGTDIGVYHILDKSIDEYSKYDILYSEPWFGKSEIYMNIFPENVELLIKLKKWEEGISKENIVREISRLVEYANHTEYSVRDALVSKYKAYYRDKDKNGFSYDFKTWRQQQVIRLMSGEFTYDSGFYIVDENYTLMNKYGLEEVKENPDQFAFLVIDMHY